MNIRDVDWNPDDRRLRDFGVVCLAVALVIAGGGVLRKWPGESLHGLLTSWRVSLPLAIGIAAAAIGLVHPRWLRPLYLVLTGLTWPIGWCVSNLVLLLMFALVFTPIAIVFRLWGRDALGRRLDRTAHTYWVHRQTASAPA